jgi:hypothetical protein
MIISKNILDRRLFDFIEEERLFLMQLIKVIISASELFIILVFL